MDGDATGQAERNEATNGADEQTTPREPNDDVDMDDDDCDDEQKRDKDTWWRDNSWTTSNWSTSSGQWHDNQWSGRGGRSWRTADQHYIGNGKG